MLRLIITAILLCLHSVMAWSFADEERDWGVSPTRDIRQPPYSAPTPRQVPGAEAISTAELQAMLTALPAPLLVDVASGDGHVTLRGAYWLPGAGRGNHYIDPLQAQLAGYLEQLSLGDKSRPLVFFCVNAQCWLSYNASLRAVALGYGRVYWYRGGIEAWREAGLPLGKVSLPSTGPPGNLSGSQ
jgi:PQQ-dependent catabolism-associated CXXCW motif protein